MYYGDKRMQSTRFHIMSFPIHTNGNFDNVATVTMFGIEDADTNDFQTTLRSKKKKKKKKMNLQNNLYTCESRFYTYTCT